MSVCYRVVRRNFKCSQTVTWVNGDYFSLSYYFNSLSWVQYGKSTISVGAAIIASVGTVLRYLVIKLDSQKIRCRLRIDLEFGKAASATVMRECIVFTLWQESSGWIQWLIITIRDLIREYTYLNEQLNYGLWGYAFLHYFWVSVFGADAYHVNWYK